MKGRLVDVLLAVFCIAMLVAMWRFTETETVPYHFLFLAVAIVYGFRVWPMRKTAVVAVLITIATGALFLRAFLGGLIGLDETTEVLLMPMLLMAMVWHARRREAAMRAVQRMADENRLLLEREHELLRDTSHAIRAPVTIARGYVDMALMDTSDPVVADHLAVVGRQLERTETLSARLLSLAALDSGVDASRDMVNVTLIVRRLEREWASAEDRNWVEDCTADLWILADATALESAIDALIENAVHFTRQGGTIRLSCRKVSGSVRIEVADSGPGIDDEDLSSVFERFWHRTPPDGIVGSGLGLAMVSAVANSHGGTATAERAPEGGALISMSFPRPTNDDGDDSHPSSATGRDYRPTTTVTYVGDPVAPAISNE